ncbi:MAG: hypothetical protein KBS59_02490, partial [Clostridiales bacterium]|nr:hypothetical protein [Clostridiales bacterium]
ILPCIFVRRIFRLSRNGREDYNKIFGRNYILRRMLALLDILYYNITYKVHIVENSAQLIHTEKQNFKKIRRDDIAEESGGNKKNQGSQR